MDIRAEVTPFRPRDGHLGFASIEINRQFFIADIAIFARPMGGIRLGYPKKILSNGMALEIFKPLNEDARQQIERAVSDTYEDLMKNGTSKPKEKPNEPCQTELFTPSR